MTTSLAVFLSFRKFFGVVVPGFCWVLLLCWYRPEILETAASRLKDVPGNAVLLGGAALLVSYLLGSATTVWAFRLLELLGDGIDVLTRRLARGRARWLIHFLQARLHLVNPLTLDEEMALRMPPLAEDPLRGTGANDAVGIAQWDVYKMYLLQESPALGREDLEIEADINFHAGLFLPVLAVAAVLLSHNHVVWGLALGVVCSLIALRFENLRHHEIIVVAQAYYVLRIRHGEATHVPSPRIST